MMFLKAFNTNGQTLHGTTPDWARGELTPGNPSPAPLLTGVWTPAFRAGQMKMCSTGWHLLPCTPYAIDRWIRKYSHVEDHRTVYLVEIAEGCTAKVVSSHSDKFIVSEARLVRKLTTHEVAALVEMRHTHTRDVMTRREYESDTVPVPKTFGTPTERRRLTEGVAWFRVVNERARVRALAFSGYRDYRPKPRVETVVVRSEDL